MSEFLARRVAVPEALGAEDGELGRGMGVGVALVTLAFMVLPAVIGVLVLMGSLR